MTRCSASVTERHWTRAWAHKDRRCHREAHLRIDGKWFCFQHYPIWLAHNAIVERIRSFPDKVI